MRKPSRRTRMLVRLWWIARERALAAIREEYPTEYADARRTWSQDAKLLYALDTPMWCTRGLADDLALHDAADSLLGLNA